MTVFSWPSGIKVASQNWNQDNNSTVLRSTLTGSVQVINRPGSAWRADITTPALDREKAGALAAFLAKLRGHTNRCYLPDFAMQTPLGSPGGSPVVSGAGQSGTAIVSSGWVSSTNILKPGDYVAIGGELKMVTQSVNSDGSGGATLIFEPPMRVSPANGSGIGWNTPVGEFILAEPQWSKSTDVNGHTRFSVSFREVF